MRAENPIGEPFIELDEVGSTNNYAMQQVQAQMAEHGKVWFAHHQTAGKGQRGNTWNTAAGQNITMSALLDTSRLILSQQFDLQITVSLACSDLLKRYCGDDVFIKWPNDVYWRDRKAGGILIENIVRGAAWQYSIAGMGLNINQTSFTETANRAVSLRQITGKVFSPVELARELCSLLQNRWKELNEGKAEQMLACYNERLFKVGQTVKFKLGNAVFNALVVRVNRSGELVVNTGSETAFTHGSVQWLFNE